MNSPTAPLPEPPLPTPLPAVDAAIERAQAALRGSRWLAIDRAEALQRAHELLRARREELARQLCREIAKPLRESRDEVDRAATTLLWSAQESLRIEGAVLPGDVTPQRLDRRVHVERFPVGVVAAITPFNFPLNIPAHKLGPALAADNAVLVKPAPRGARVTAALVDLLHEAGVPADRLEVLHGGAEVVERLVRGNVQAISFTGSTRVGTTIAGWAAGRRLVMELGGCDPIVVLEDADLDAAAKAIVAHRFGFSGQRCTACKRALIHAAVYEPLKERLLAGVGQLVLGPPEDERTDVGPLIGEQAAADLEARVAAAEQRGAHRLCGGTRQGALLTPTVLEGLAADDPLVQEETFGPVLPLFRFATFDEAVRLVNSTPYGLQAGVFTRRLDYVLEAYRRFEVGTVIVNDGPGLRIEPIPFGGVKASGLGREGIRQSIMEFTVSKGLVL